METSRDFTTFVKKFCQTLIVERSFRDMSNVKNDRCAKTDHRKEENSCTQVVFILAGNDYEEKIRFLSTNDNAIPLLFNMKGKTYEKVNGFPLTSPLTIFFRDTPNVNLVVQEAPLEKISNLMMTCLNSAWDNRLEEVNLENWKNKSEANNSSGHVSKNCSFKPHTIFHIRKDRQPLTLVQLCYAKLIVDTLEKCQGK
jgi:hypothetical protein